MRGGKYRQRRDDEGKRRMKDEGEAKIGKGEMRREGEG